MMKMLVLDTTFMTCATYMPNKYILSYDFVWNMSVKCIAMDVFITSLHLYHDTDTANINKEVLNLQADVWSSNKDGSLGQ